VSDPLDGYTNQTSNGMPVDLTPVEDGFKFTEDVTTPGTPTDVTFDEPIDRKIDPQHYDGYLKDHGLRPAYRTVHLQRLANPMLRFDPRTNPYRTIDSSAIDLFVFNGVEIGQDPNNTPGTMRFGTFERRSDKQGGTVPSRERLLFKNDRWGHQNADESDSPEFPNDNHIFRRNLVESLGGLNAGYREDPPNQPPDLRPFAWLSWNNRPYTSELEMVNVPFTSSYWLTRLFGTAQTGRNVFAPPVSEQSPAEARNYTAHFPHLLNFYSDRNADGSPAPSLHRLFDVLEVPSRFVGTESYVNPATFSGTTHGLSFGLAPPFDTISNYRYPGKLNINTVLDERVWNGLMRLYALDVSYSDWARSRNGSATGFSFANPYRSAQASNNVPPVPGMLVSPVACGLFRPDGTGEPLFDFKSNELYNNTDRSAYFKYDMRQRLGNLVTSRSSVFAIWITIGYFEVDLNGNLKNANSGGVEVGGETGRAIRHRGFYIFDRSIPMAFEPGQNHNVDRGVLVKTIIE